MTAALCALALGCIALWLALALRRVQRTNQELRSALEARKQKYIALGLAMEQAHIACMRGDGAALHEAVSEANRVMADVPSGRVSAVQADR